jgi:hypothetical protein
LYAKKYYVLTNGDSQNCMHIFVYPCYMRKMFVCVAALWVEGIFRRSASALSVREVQRKFNHGKDVAGSHGY